MTIIATVAWAILLCCTALASAALVTESEARAEFADFVIKYSKAYEQQELERRFGIFKAQLELVRAHNAGNWSWTAGINEFSDWTDEEFWGPPRPPTKPPARRIEPSPLFARAPEKGFVDRDIDWINATLPVKNILTPLRDRCNTWPFAAVAVTESYNFLYAKNPLIALSEQQVLDCTKMTDCFDGTASAGVGYLVSGPGYHSAKTYGAWADTKIYCDDYLWPTVGKLKGLDYAWPSNDTVLYNYLLRQPVAAGLWLQSSQAFRMYRGGLFDGVGACPEFHNLFDFWVTVVAYGRSNEGKPYWLIRNSWGPAWGGEGHMAIAAHKNLCGIESWNTIPL